LLLFGSFSQVALLRKGICSNYQIDVLGLGFATVGHVTHHIEILKERYFSM
jgi:hypothetical protein